MIVLKTAQEKLLSALQSVAGIVERRHTLPILANVLLRKTGEQVDFTTSDLEIQVRTSATFEGDASSFATTVGARKLIDILRSLPADQAVTLSSNQNKLTLQAAITGWLVGFIIFCGAGWAGYPRCAGRSRRAGRRSKKCRWLEVPLPRFRRHR